MADNVAYPVGSGTTVATDDVGGVHYQKVKLAIGASDAATLLTGGAGSVDAGTQRVTHASDDPAVAAIGSAVTTLGSTTGAAVITDANGTIQQYVRGLVTLELVSKAVLDAILAKIIAAPATSALQTTGNALQTSGNTALASILAKIIAAPATEAKQDTLIAKDFATQTTLAAVLAKIIAAPATSALQDALNLLVGLTNDPAAADPDAVASLNALIRGHWTDTQAHGTFLSATSTATQALAAAAASSTPAPVIAAMADTPWYYPAASGGILNTTTAVTIKSAAGAGKRSYVSTAQLSSEALTTASELAIRDGAAGAVLWRTKIGTAGLLAGREFVFDPPLQSSVNTLLEVVMLTASGAGAAYFNAQGFDA